MAPLSSIFGSETARRRSRMVEIALITILPSKVIRESSDSEEDLWNCSASC